MPNRYPPRLLAITATYSENASGAYDGYEIDASGGAVTLTLQSPASRGRRTVSNTGASGNATVATAGTSATINGGSSVTLYPGDSMTVVANGLTGSSAAWRVVGGNIGDAAGVTPGTATASKALVLDASKGIATITTATITTATIPNFAGAEAHAGIITPTGGIAAAGGFSARPRGIHTGQHAAYVSTDGNDSTPSTTETYVSEIFVPCNMTITGIALFNGSNVTGNVTVGLATSAGAPITAAKSASTAGSGTDAYQLVPFASSYAAVGPATYFIQVQYSSATARYNTHTLGTHAVLVQTGQTYGTFASFTAPTTFVTAVSNICGLY